MDSISNKAGKEFYFPPIILIERIAAENGFAESLSGTGNESYQGEDMSWD